MYLPILRIHQQSFRLSPTTVISFHSGLIDVCCIKSKLLGIKEVHIKYKLWISCECNCHAWNKKISLRQSNNTRNLNNKETSQIQSLFALLDYATFPSNQDMEFRTWILLVFFKFSCKSSISHLFSYKGKLSLDKSIWKSKASSKVNFFWLEMNLS